ncbi:MAG: Holliday junction resolvase RuvX [Clostridia bacterium]|nr:Holliday junction resolvase RuvX [Clostridia bacterium]
MARKMGLDLGNVNIGIAFSDPLGMFASGFLNYRRQSLEQDLQYLADLVKEKDVDTIVVGLPKNMDGSDGERVKFTYDFCEKLASSTPAQIVYQDERLSTVSAEKMLIEADVRRDKRKQVIDKVAASIILQNYLDKKF